MTLLINPNSNRGTKSEELEDAALESALDGRKSYYCNITKLLMATRGDKDTVATIDRNQRPLLR